VTETAIRFGEGLCLTGIVTAPPQGPARDVGVLILNAGLVHHVGPSRVGVELARRAASAGFVALRFDRSNLGDSRARADVLPVEARAVAEVREAMDQLAETHGLRRFVLFGICSGAEHALGASLEDARVVGAVLVDGYAYRTPRFYARHYGPRLFRRESWRRLLVERTAVGRWLRGATPDLDGNGRQASKRRFPPRPHFRRSLELLANRRVELLIVYTGGGMSDWYNYAEQFFDSLPGLRGRSVEVVYLGAVDHRFSRARSRAALLEAFERWADRFTWRAAHERPSAGD
jgi:hypothetical protein